MKHRHPCYRLWSVAAAMWLALSIVAAPARAADACEDELNQAESHYAIGRFADALTEIRACLSENPARTVEIRMLALEAKVLVALDDLAAAAASLTRLLELDAAYRTDPRDPPRFVRLVEQLQRGDDGVTISSVSKVAEGLREAPATVLVITAEEIRRRGYVDLEQVFHDLPGFDVSRTNGAFYANVYQRGFRSDLTERTLLLIDGVEENSLSVGAAYLSRQYPLSNIQQIDVIYGPASTMYGANAFAGVINIITRQPRELFERQDGAGSGKNVRVEVDAFGGSRSTEGVEVNAAGRHGSLSWSLTGRFFASDELDLAGFEDWDYDPAYFEDPAVPYSDRLSLSTPQDAAGFVSFLAGQGLTDCDGMAGCPYRLVQNGQGELIGVELTPAGAQLAASLDAQAYDSLLGGQPISFSDPTEDWLVSGKLQLPNLTFGFQTWRREEGAIGWYSDRAAPGADNGHLWVPQQSWLYLDYSRDLSPTVTLRLFGRFKEQETTGDTNLTFLSSYDRGSFGLQDLVQGRAASWTSRFFFESSNELRGEATVIYRPSKRFNLVSGIELRNNSIARDFVLSLEPNPSETGDPTVPAGQGSNQLNGRDLGFYAQANYRVRDDVKLVFGGRLDHNDVRDTLGFGTVFNSRLGVVYSPGEWVLKAMWSTAFQDASNIQKFGTNQGIRVGNPTLQPEEVDNYELSVSWQPRPNLDLEAALYRSEYSGVAQSTQASCAALPEGIADFCNPGQSTISQFQNLGNLEITGAQLRFDYEPSERFSLWGNYTYTDPRNIDPLDASGNPVLDASGGVIGEQPVGDIAEHQVNLGLNGRFFDALDGNLRINYVGDRPTGAGTTVTGNPFSQIDSHLVAHLALTYEGLFRGTSLQLVVNNLFDEQYFDPGIRDASQVLYAPRAPQPGRSAFLRLRYDF